ncbi:efflux RND transporter permease subunit [Anaerosalibacter bizertensis]|uniref:efflux RND transporter permease subunit n=1 Tax=Anaerosalibacter bizertensis TaxID=932217 RepID=UPI001C0E99B3|nr:efflux RND transporter permease subunit [Anaerosalibacter bizertensis]MBU5294813.1 efflux RND transporter permease subunit [Anaerosalibacter bizertensis]
MSLYSFSVKKPITLLMIVCVVIITGIVSLTKIPLDLLPKIEVPVAVVSTSYKGVGPEEIEKLVTEPIEGAVATVGSMKNIQSISYDGNSLIIVEFNSGTDMDFASLEMREKIDLVKGFLPDEVENPMVIKVDPNAMPIIQLSFYSEEDLGKLQSILMEIVKPRIERIERVANVSLSGGKEKEVNISLEEGELEK